MKNLFPLLVFLSFLSCSSMQESPTPPVAEDSTKISRLDFNLTDYPLDEPAGKNVFFAYKKSTLENALGPQLAQKVQATLEEQLKKKGFRIVTSSRKAHLLIFVIPKKYIGGMGRWEEIPLTENPKERGSVTVTTTVVKGGESTTSRKVLSDMYHRIFITAGVQKYGKRIQGGPELSFGVNADGWDGISEELVNLINENFEKLGIRTPKPQKMAGDPGCMPRFGFDTELKEKNGSKLQVISKVYAGSSAEKIGIKKGDVIIAIDSSSYEEFNSRKDNIELYEKFLSVPIKFQRKDKIFRQTIKPTVICTNDESWMKQKR